MRFLLASALRASSVLLLVGPLAACGDDSDATAGSGGGSTSSGTATTSGSGGSGTTTGSSTTTGSTTSSSTATGSGGAGGGDGGGGGQGGTGDAGGGGGELPAFGDECSSSEDCFGAECVELNGYHTCRAEVEQATGCTEGQQDECCDTSECAGPDEICTLMPDAYCGGPAPQLANQCVSTDDQCLELDCAAIDAVCAPPGTFTFRAARCVSRACSGNADCTEGPGGSCVPVANPCCNGTSGFFCAYAGEGCRSNADCQGDAYCNPDFETGVASCVPGFAQCPS